MLNSSYGGHNLNRIWSHSIISILRHNSKMQEEVKTKPEL